MASAANKAPASGGARRVLLFPLPFQGHINPMLQLAAVLHARGLRVTVFHSAFNAPDPARRPAGYRFVTVGASVPIADLVPTGSHGTSPRRSFASTSVSRRLSRTASASCSSRRRERRHAWW
ncbi:hypothetical protein CFC21_038377 [Triticum aestivum]|uniref:Glycosyltransferase n=3 Tax=Triticum TaxID=4564 RepID=A0A9R0VU42_TRITD|nr:hypothetical protein CFC21_038377 [Triticum aestivum]VAH69744.1 unnamed protein product [Triticum turgidum subsp. durum]